MKPYYIAFLLFVTLFVNGTAQEIRDFDYFFSTNMSSVYKDPAQTVKGATYFLLKATNDVQKAKALYLQSEGEKLQGNYIESVTHLFQSYSYAHASEAAYVKALISISIATYCRNSGMNDLSEEYLSEAKRSVPNITNIDEQKIINAKLLNEKAIRLKHLETVEKALPYTNKARRLLEGLNNPIPRLLVGQYNKVGEQYLNTSKKDSARFFYSEAMILLQKSNLQNSALEAETLLGLGTLAVANDTTDGAKKIILQALNMPVVEPSVKVSLFETLSVIAQQEEDSSTGQWSKNEQTRLNATMVASERNVRNTIISHIEETQQQKTHQEENKYYYIGGILFGVLVCALFVYYLYNKKLDREYEKFEKIIRDIENEKRLKTNHSVQEVSTVSRGISIPAETEATILTKLNAFENSTKYTKENMSLALLAKQMDTNTKYVSEIIHRHKSKNFNTYINELRVNYIIQLLKNDPKYLSYKVSYLAETCGFSSHSAFTVVFKSITGITPKQFISFLKKSEKVAS
ncbi:helix-turn-helix domain-containing protein [Cochleicola gelatinilyticus]|uniref:HTH araC/xylS-type domain-containing protein n=1 Tax=Cochleicola gelatinilyticus TaxID=1763537 RepID=A0A167GAD4_9FLAO|nr:helix-turn-helix transcriptional regulator [Cochleicola gelatinilyticus]OAB77382.1 hypothetical protein ULVI_12850 [Cochleicola gelatinilyticus]